MARGIANPELARDLLKWYAASPGVVLHYTDAAAGLHIENAKTVNASLGRLARMHPERGLERVGDRGGNYVYRPDRVNNPLLPAVPEPPGPSEMKPGELLEVVGATESGDPIVRVPGESRLWRLIRI
jgi:hypothetical protein